MSWEKKDLTKSLLSLHLSENAKKMPYFSFNNFPTVFKEIDEKLGDTFMAVILYSLVAV